MEEEDKAKELTPMQEIEILKQRMQELADKLMDMIAEAKNQKELKGE